MNPEPSTEELLARVARHDAEALSELYDLYSPSLFGMMAHILPSREMAEDVLQDVFLRLWSASPGLSEAGISVAAWLVVIGRERAVERLRALRANAADHGRSTPRDSTKKGPESVGRKHRGGSAASNSAKSLEVKATGPAPFGTEKPRDSILARIPLALLPQTKEINLIDGRLALLHKVLDQLPKPQRQALELAVFGGMSEAEVAAETGEPLGKAQRSLRAAVTFVKHRRRAVCGTWAANI